MSGARFAILIGASEFPEEPRLSSLRCPINDVEGLSEVLGSPEYGGFSEVAVFKNRPHNEINFKINEVLNRATKDDFVLIYYSGHGKLDRSGRLHLTTNDTRLDVLGATSVSWPRVVDYLRDAYTTKVAVLLDCCYGGAAGASFKGTVEDQLQQATQARGTYVMTAATSTELAREREQDDYGLFTKHVIEGIKTGDADLDGDGQISMDDLFRYVDSHLKQEGGQQPTMTGIDVRGELYIAKSKHSRRDERLTKLRKKLYPLAAKEVVADALVKAAIEIASLKPADMTEEERRLDELLDAYLANKVSVGELGRRWFSAEGAAPPAAAEPEKTVSEPIQAPPAGPGPSPVFDFELSARKSDPPIEVAPRDTPAAEPKAATIKIPEKQIQTTAPGPKPVPEPKKRVRWDPLAGEKNLMKTMVVFFAGAAASAVLFFTVFRAPERQPEKSGESKPLESTPAVEKVLEPSDLRTMLQSMGFVTTAIDSDPANMKTQFNVKKGTLDIPLQAEVTTSRRFIWLTAMFESTADYADYYSRAAKILEENGQIQPCQFFVTSSGKLKMALAIDNRNVDSTVLRARIDKISEDIASTEGLWKR